MKKIKELVVVAISLIFILSACTMEKRHYMSGYDIQWKNGEAKVSKKAVTEPNVNVASNTNNTQNAEPAEKIEQSKTLNTNNFEASNDNMIASTDNSVYIPSTSKNELVYTGSYSAPSQSKINLSTERTIIKANTRKTNKAASSGSNVPKILLYILCFIIPPLAVGLATNWNWTKVVINILWCFLCGIPGIIHAIINVSKSK